MYSRFDALKNFNKEDKRKLKDSKAAIIGLGATGSVIAENLARHKVKLKIIDRDFLEENDLYSSNIYTPEDCSKTLPKARAAEKYLKQFTKVESEIKSLNSGNIKTLSNCDIILDGTDNLKTRFLINEYSKKEEVPWVYTSAIGEKAYSMFFNEKCFNCIFDKVKPGKLETCETAGILRETAHKAALESSKKAIKYLSGKKPGEKFNIVHKGRKLEFSNPGCKTCEEEKYPYLKEEESIETVCGENKYQINKETSSNARKNLKKAGKVKKENKYLIKAELNEREFVLFNSGRAIIEARDKGHAASIYSEILGI